MIEDHNFIENELVILTKQTIDVFLKEKNFMDLISLYTFYYYTAKWQKTNSIKCTTGYAAKGMHCGQDKIRKTKAKLIEYGLIKDVIRKNEKGKITWHYIQMNYIFKKDTVENIHPTKNPECRQMHSVENHETNALSTNNINALSTNNINTTTDFEKFWKLYDKKVGKEKCIKKWNKIKQEVKTLIYNTLDAYIRSTPDKSYRKNPLTYLNNKTWNDEIIQPFPDNKKRDQPAAPSEWFYEWDKKQKELDDNRVLYAEPWAHDEKKENRA